MRLRIWVFKVSALGGVLEITVWAFQRRVNLLSSNHQGPVTNEGKPGNAGVSRTAIGELAHNTGLNQGRVFSLFGFCTAISYVVGPLVGGFLARPTEKFSSFHHAKLFVEYPYLLPCALSALYNVLVAAISWPFLHETNENIHKSSSKATAAADETQPEDATAREPLLKGTPPVAIADVVPRNAAWYCIFGVG